jgi:hypothetical protein
VGGTTEGRGLEGSAQESLLELLVGPTVFTTMGAQLTCGVKTTRLSFTYIAQNLSLVANQKKKVDKRIFRIALCLLDVMRRSGAMICRE